MLCLLMMANAFITLTLVNINLFAGFPRTVLQAEKLGERQQLDVVINLDVPFETIIDRISVSLI